MSGAPSWLWHVAASLLGAALVALLAPLLHRRFSLSEASRHYWRAAWLLAALPAPLALAISYFAPAMVTSALPVLAPLGDWTAAPLPPGSAAAGVQAAVPATAILLLIYASGVGTGALRWAIGAFALRRMLRAALPADASWLPGPASRRELERLTRAGVRIVVMDRRISPFALPWPRATIALPRALRTRLDDAQWQLVLRHEAAHLAHRDAQWALAMRLAGLLLWFNPSLRPLARRVQLAAELGSDAAALGARKDMRRAYAQAYLETLRMSMTRALPCPAVAFSHPDQGSHRMRIGHIVHGDPNARRRPVRSLALALLALTCGGGFAAVQAAAAGAAPARVVFSGPIIAGRISSDYGTLRPGISQGRHNGVDLTAARGTPVHAPAAGTVQVATATYAPQPRYGTVVVIDHGAGWQTVYAHLDGFDVQAGERVEAGQQIGRVGSTGQATGPHVHVELHREGVRVDPASAIAPLVAAR
jgi:murein DD-endopeptidase MepM/ murein hydrolase activator NlpD